MNNDHNFKHLKWTMDIKEFRGNPEHYKAIIDTLVEHGHSFAVYGGKLYFSQSAYERLTSGRTT